MIMKIEAHIYFPVANDKRLFFRLIPKQMVEIISHSFEVLFQFLVTCDNIPNNHVQPGLVIGQ